MEKRVCLKCDVEKKWSSKGTHICFVFVVDLG